MPLCPVSKPIFASPGDLSALVQLRSALLSHVSGRERRMGLVQKRQMSFESPG